MAGITITLLSTGQKVTAQLQVVPNECFCNRDLTVEDIKTIIRRVRKEDNKQDIQQLLNNFKEYRGIHPRLNDDEHIYFYNDNETKKFFVKYGNEFYYLEKYAPITKEEYAKFGKKIIKYKKPNCKFDDLKHNIFHSSQKEKMLGAGESNAFYQKFVNALNTTFKKYDINTCLRRAHFLAQCYVETEEFRKAYEGRESVPDNYQGGVDYQGRGLLHLTHDYNYLAYYDYKNNTSLFEVYTNNRTFKKENQKIIYERLIAFNNRTGNSMISVEQMNDLKEFAKKLSTDIVYAVDAAGWWWKRNNINEDADKDDVKKVTLKVNGGTNALTKRKDYTNMFKDAMNFKDCKNKNE